MNDLDALLYDSLSSQRSTWTPHASQTTVTLGADDILPLKMNVWAHVLLGGSLDVEAVADAIEADAVIQGADEVEIQLYCTHLLVASKASKQLEAWGLLESIRRPPSYVARPFTLAEPSSPEARNAKAPTSVSSSLRGSALRLLDPSPRHAADDADRRAPRPLPLTPSRRDRDAEPIAIRILAFCCCRRRRPHAHHSPAY